MKYLLNFLTAAHPHEESIAIALLLVILFLTGNVAAHWTIAVFVVLWLVIWGCRAVSRLLRWFWDLFETPNFL